MHILACFIRLKKSSTSHTLESIIFSRKSLQLPLLNFERSMFRLTCDTKIFEKKQFLFFDQIPFFFLSQICEKHPNVKATDIIQEVDVLKAISWIKSAWAEVLEETIVNCFKKCVFRKSQPDVLLTDFAEE